MKVSVKITKYIIAINAIYFITVIGALLFELNQQLPPFYFTMIRELLFDAQLIYLVYVLKQFHEKKAYINTFIVFIVFNFILTFLSDVTPPHTNGAMLLFFLSILKMIMNIALIIAFFKLRNDELRLPFALFGLAYLSYFLFYITSGILIVLVAQIFMQISGFSLLFVPASLCYALIGITKYLKNQDELNRSISEFRTQ
ncbi:hypothetical protein [Mucilaginibacter sp. OK283]|uniref:hypothetical protein n=1 Tax=Mucilaginibacter sp. OK283 TaxID=1881049 RepID=UPI0008C666CD|nr:hypothetical protein [Mucilaginibacter sp. OK283]SEO84747.1 hypothetical protein SAMN05428947_104319 [Mucilaginibacter sp. OK283]